VAIYEPFDPIQKAKHYNLHPSGVECIEVIEHFDFVIGSIIKYAWRAGLKDQEPTLKDLQKCAYYAQRAVSREEKRLKRAAEEAGHGVRGENSVR
jgi:hypothetical protein